MARVSVIIPIYNVEDYLEQCLDSVLNQTFTDIEIICILDGPTDRSGFIAKKYAQRDPRMAIIEQPNSGVSIARNSGLKEVTSEYIVFIDSDDRIAPKYIERLYDTICSTDSGMVICNYHYGKKDGSFIPNSPLPDGVYEPGEICRELILDRTFHNYTWNKMIKKKVMEEHNILFPEGILLQDMAVMSEIAYYSGKVAVIDEYLYYYYCRTNSNLNTYKPKRFKDVFTSMAKVKTFLVRENLYEKYQVEYEYACASHLIGSANLISKEVKELTYLLPSLKECFCGLLGGRNRILHKTRKMMTIHQRLAMQLFLVNPQIYAFFVSRKWI